MKKLCITFLIFIVNIINFGCIDLSNKTKINENYSLSYIDVRENMSLYYSLEDDNGIGRIDHTVYAVGWDNNFIIAKQHPNNNRKIRNYFILEMKKDSKYADPKESVIGPLTSNQFIDERKRLRVPDELDFKIVLKDLE